MLRYTASGEFEISVPPGVTMTSYALLQPRKTGFVNADALAVAASFMSPQNTALTQFATTRRCDVWSLLKEVAQEMCDDTHYAIDVRNLAEFARWAVNEVIAFQYERDETAEWIHTVDL
jgi:Na+/serine symporter